MANPILDTLEGLASEGLHPEAVHVIYHPGGSVIQVLLGDFVELGEGRASRPEVPPGVRVLGWERYPDHWGRLKEAEWKQVETWVHEAAWLSNATDWTRMDSEVLLQEHEIAGLYGPYAELGVEMQPTYLRWLFKPNKWPHPRLLRSPKVKELAEMRRSLADLKKWKLPERRKNHQYWVTFY